jgi:CubicO group peptidase (beta-lactamase class C family)
VRDLVKRAGRRGHRSITAAVTTREATTFGAWSARGPHPSPDTVFEIGSITKAFTGVLLADMHLRGEVALDSRLSAYRDGPAPAWREREPTLGTRPPWVQAPRSAATRREATRVRRSRT